MGKAKILVTFGPAIGGAPTFRKIAQTADGVRINTAHGSVRDHGSAIAFIRKNSPLPVVLDIKGPELRVFLDEPLNVKAGSLFTIGFSGPARFSYDFSREAKKGDPIHFDDGKLDAEIVKISPKGAEMRAKNPHSLKGGKNAHIPGRRLSIPSLSAKDVEEIALANKKSVEYVALSFTRTAGDVRSLRSKLDSGIAIIAKVENAEGLANADGILSEADGIMVARGDLALDIGAEKVPLAQKALIKKCNNAGKLAITATQVLETMIANPYPTRAEVSDIANAVLDGTDALMLSGETAIGAYPLEAVRTMDKVSAEAESSVGCNVGLGSYADISDAVSKSINTIARIMPLDAVVSITRSGYTAKMISRFRLNARVIALTPNEQVRRQLLLYFGVEPFFVPEIPESRIIPTMAQFLASKKLVSPNSVVLFTAGVRTRAQHASNLIELHKLDELLKK